MFYIFKAFRVMALAAAIAIGAIGAIGFSAPLIASEHGEDPLTREELLAAALAGDPVARIALLELFNSAQGDSSAVAALAVELIDALEGDPVAITDAATLIADVATEILTTQPIVRIAGDRDFTLPPGAVGWDLGSPDSPGFPGFTKLSQFDQGIVTGASGGLQRPGGGGLLSDGLVNVTRITLKVGVPDGTYRLILLTDDQGNTVFVNPLGRAIIVNGVRTTMPTGSPNIWVAYGQLGGSTGTGTGGATVIIVQVINGRLVIEFEAAGNSDMLLTGLILEPVDGPSVLYTPENIFEKDDAILLAEAVIADAIGQTLENIATAAGDEGTREEILNLDEPEAEVTDAVSPS